MKWVGGGGREEERAGDEIEQGVVRGVVAGEEDAADEVGDAKAPAATVRGIRVDRVRIPCATTRPSIPAKNEKGEEREGEGEGRERRGEGKGDGKREEGA